MNCPDCGAELMAIGGIPTVWKCNPCTRERYLKNIGRPDTKFIGDTLKTLKRM